MLQARYLIQFQPEDLLWNNFLFGNIIEWNLNCLLIVNSNHIGYISSGAMFVTEKIMYKQKKKSMLHKTHNIERINHKSHMRRKNFNIPFAASSRLRMRRRERPWGVRTRVPLGLMRYSRWYRLHWWERRWWCCCRWTRSECGWSSDWSGAPGLSCGCLCSPGDTTPWSQPGCTARCTHTAACLQQNDTNITKGLIELMSGSCNWWVTA
jgi:hypothetical protein